METSSFFFILAGPVRLTVFIYTSISFCLAACIFSFSARAQVPYILEKEFKTSLKSGYSEADFKRLYHILDSLEKESVNFSEFKAYSIYSGNIEKMLKSINFYQRGIAYQLLSSLNDKRFNDLLLERLKSESNSFLKTLNAAAVMRLIPSATTPAFDFLVDCDDFATSPLLPAYLAMKPESIIRTAYERLEDKRPKARVFALQILARFDDRPEVDSIIIKALKNWDDNLKGYAIVALGIHRKGEYKDILEPYLRLPLLKEVILETLQKSNTPEDHIFAENLKRKR